MFTFVSGEYIGKVRTCMTLTYFLERTGKSSRLSLLYIYKVPFQNRLRYSVQVCTNGVSGEYLGQVEI